MILNYFLITTKNMLKQSKLEVTKWNEQCRSLARLHLGETGQLFESSNPYWLDPSNGGLVHQHILLYF